MEYDQTIMTALLGMAVLVWALMDGVGKPAIYKLVELYNARTRLDIKSEHKPLIVRVVAALIGIAFVWGSDGGVSFAEMWGIEIVNYHWIIDAIHNRWFFCAGWSPFLHKY